MQLTTRTIGDTLQIAVSGEWDAATAPLFDRQCPAFAKGPARQLALDLSGLKYLSSAGVRSILGLARQVKDAGGSLALCGATGMVQSVLTMSGIGTLLPVHDSVDAMLAKRGAGQ